MSKYRCSTKYQYKNIQVSSQETHFCCGIPVQLRPVVIRFQLSVMSNSSFNWIRFTTLCKWLKKSSLYSNTLDVKPIPTVFDSPALPALGPSRIYFSCLELLWAHCVDGVFWLSGAMNIFLLVLWYSIENRSEFASNNCNKTANTDLSFLSTAFRRFYDHCHRCYNQLFGS